ncbi:hypothetical protein BT63DRAFT_460898 [Microthyrium microscopicum]|uniref:Uncharacterized protein n=1 Tax=Microthyrium microscopicum TaxID=703497 RepID=A0A6A6TXR5_9PEZI|nr:hypothetical protein BT63DRAFT_460898 [Microthyrium microscopicum]
MRSNQHSDDRPALTAPLSPDKSSSTSVLIEAPAPNATASVLLSDTVDRSSYLYGTYPNKPEHEWTEGDYQHISDQFVLKFGPLNVKPLRRNEDGKVVGFHCVNFPGPPDFGIPTVSMIRDPNAECTWRNAEEVPVTEIVHRDAEGWRVLVCPQTIASDRRGTRLRNYSLVGLFSTCVAMKRIVTIFVVRLTCELRI